MGTYATTTSFSQILSSYFKGGSDTSDTTGSAIVSRHITNAEAMVNAFVAARYSLPFSPVPPLLTSLTEQLAAYETIKSSTWMDPKQKNAYLDEFRKANDILKGLMEGTIKLTYTDGSLVPVNSTMRFKSSTDGYTPIFGRDDPRSWERDENEVSDTEASRS